LIPANSVLVFDLELIAIKDPAQLQGGEPEAEAPADAPAEAPAK